MVGETLRRVRPDGVTLSAVTPRDAGRGGSVLVSLVPDGAAPLD
jgi:hypothetical protein